MSEIFERMREAAERIGVEEWHHVQPFERLPPMQTIHGSVPACYVDYVSTWQGPGTPRGHRVIVPMEEDRASVRSTDKAHIAASSPANVLALLEDRDRLAAENARLREAIKRQASAARTLQASTLEQVRHLQEKDRSEYVAEKTLDSERAANAILTEENARLREALAGLANALEIAPGPRGRLDLVPAALAKARAALSGKEDRG